VDELYGAIAAEMDAAGVIFAKGGVGLVEDPSLSQTACFSCHFGPGPRI
jgi:hypothetical protein